MIAVGGTRRAGSLAIAVLSGILLRMHHQAVLVAHTRGHAETSHLLTRDLRQRPLRSRYRLRTRREQIAIVLQEPVVLTGSVRENLRYGDGSTRPTDNPRRRRTTFVIADRLSTVPPIGCCCSMRKTLSDGEGTHEAVVSREQSLPAAGIATRSCDAAVRRTALVFMQAAM